jgi:hypothetical protein
VPGVGPFGATEGSGFGVQGSELDQRDSFVKERGSAGRRWRQCRSARGLSAGPVVGRTRHGALEEGLTAERGGVKDAETRGRGDTERNDEPKAEGCRLRPSTSSGLRRAEGGWRSGGGRV